MEKKSNPEIKRSAGRAWLAGLLMTIIALGGAGCSRKVYVPLERVAVRADTVVQLRWRTDSVVVRDSVMVAQRGDTVVLTRVRDRWRSREVRDTLWRVRCDTVVQERLPAAMVRESMADGGKGVGVWRWWPLLAGALIAAAALMWPRSR